MFVYFCFYRFADGAVLPPIPQESCNLDLPPNRALSRSASQPVLFPFKQRDIHNKQQHPPVIENVCGYANNIFLFLFRMKMI